MGGGPGERLVWAASALIAVTSNVEPDRWCRVPAHGVWSIGKETETRHRGRRLPRMDRSTDDRAARVVPPTGPRTKKADHPPHARGGRQAAACPQRCKRGSDPVPHGRETLAGDQAPRSCGETLAATIERVMIGHYDTHRAAIKAKATDAPDAASA